MSPLRMLPFLLVVVGLTGGVHRFLWARLVRDPGWPEPWNTLGGALVAGLAVALLLAFFLQRLAPRVVATPAALVGYTWLGVLFYVLLALLPLELGRLGASAASAIGLLDLPDAGRRALLARMSALTVAGGAAALGLVGLVTSARGPQITRTKVPIPGLGAGLDGLRIVQLSDIHLGPTLGAAFMERVVQATNALDPDLVVITGDLVDGTVDQLREAAAPLAGLHSRHGTYFVTGNHEYYSGAVSWVRHLGTLGVRVLRNERVPIQRDGALLELAGTDDYRAAGMAPGHGEDLEGALSGRDPAVPVILLAHQPKTVLEASQRGVALQLSGHTHGGQFVPWDRVVRLDQPAVAGLYRFGETWLYVSRGTGYWGPPMRVGVPAEIAVVELSAEA